MTSEWMKVMLDEIARKRTEAEEARLEQQRRDAFARDEVVVESRPVRQTINIS